MLLKLLGPYGKNRIAILGLGDRLRSDDAAGCRIAEALKRILKNRNILIQNAGQIPENYLGVITDFRPDLVLLIDALHFDGAPGGLILLNPDRLKETGTSTHNASLALVAGYLRNSGVKSVSLLGIQPKELKLGGRISPEVEKGIGEIVGIFKKWKTEAKNGKRDSHKNRKVGAEGRT